MDTGDPLTFFSDTVKFAFVVLEEMKILMNYEVW